MSGACKDVVQRHLAGTSSQLSPPRRHCFRVIDARPLVTSVIIRVMCSAFASGRSAVMVTPASVKLS